MRGYPVPGMRAGGGIGTGDIEPDAQLAQLLHTAHQLSLGIMPPYTLPLTDSVQQQQHNVTPFGMSSNAQTHQQYLALLAQAQSNLMTSSVPSSASTQLQQLYSTSSSHRYPHSRTPSMMSSATTSSSSPHTHTPTRRAASTSGPNAGAAPMNREQSSGDCNVSGSCHSSPKNKHKVGGTYNSTTLGRSPIHM
jgi:hypothetical protein